MASSISREKGHTLRDRMTELSRLVASELSEIERAAKTASVEELERMLSALRSIHDARDRDLESELSSLSAFLQRNSEREKAALARELHDELGGILTPAKMDLAWLQARLGGNAEYCERMNRLSKLIDQGIDLKRRVIETLRPSLLDHLGLASALQWYVQEACESAKLECTLEISDDLERLPGDLEIALYRLVQESMTNIVKHAKAKSVTLNVERTAKGLRVTISDDGVGIADLEVAKKLSHGLSGMSHRIRSLRGTFDIRSQQGQGTRIEAFVPLEAKKAVA
jgi:signal transduction histidine kinase